MSEKTLSLETRASSAFVQGRLAELVKLHCDCEGDCTLGAELGDLLQEWKQAEAELAEARAELTVNNEKESK